MAVRDKARKPNIIDRDRNIFIGIDTPIRKSEGPAGYFAATTTVLESVKNNIRNLLQTHQGERYLQPTLGMNLRKFLFEMANEEVMTDIETEILEQISIHLSYLQVDEVIVSDSEFDPNIPENTINVSISYRIENTRESDVLNLSLDVSDSGMDDSISYWGTFNDHKSTYKLHK